MTTDPPPVEFEDVRIGNWQGRLPSAICTNKEIFDEIFSLETWKTVLQPEQRDRILKTLPHELLKTPGAAEKTIEDLFSKSLTNFGNSPLETFFDKLDNGHYDPEVVETKTNIVREWKRESLRLRKHYHTKLLQDIVISRDKQLRKLIVPSPVHKKNGKKSISNNNNNNNNGPSKKNGKGPSTVATTTNGNATNGISAVGTKGKSNHLQNNTNSKSENVVASITNVSSRNSGSIPLSEQTSSKIKNKRGRLETALLSPPNSAKDVSSSSPEGPSRKKSKNSSSKSKAGSTKKSKDKSNASISQPPPSPSSQLINSPLLMGNGTGTHQKTSLLLGTLTTGSSPLEPPTLSLRSPSSLSGATSTSSLLESLTSPISQVSHISSGHDSNGGISKQYSKIFPSPVLASSPVSTSQSPAFLPSPVQSSPILASQLQAPSPISVNLSTITGGGLSSSRNGSISGSPSHSSITLNYTQPPTPTSLPPPSSTITSLQQSGKGLMEDDSSSDEFEFETIEPTIGFGGPSAASKSSGANLKSSTTSAGYSSSTNNTSTTKKTTGPISSQELANIKKCSLLTNCLTQPLSSNSSSAAAVTAALANNILTSTPVPVSTAVAFSTGSSTVQQLLQQQQQPQKIIVTSSGIVTSCSSTNPPPQSTIQQHQQLDKFLSTSSAMTMNTSSSTKLVAHQQMGIFQQQIQKNVVSASSATGPVAVDAQTFVNTLMASSKDLLSTFSSSIGGVTSTPPEIRQIQVQQQQQHNSTSNVGVLPISVNLQGVQEHQSHFKQTTFIRATGPVITQQQQQSSQQILSLQSNPTAQPIVVVGQSSSLNTQSLQLPSSILTNSSSGISTSNKVSITGVPTSSVVATAASIPNLLDSDDLNLSLGSFTLGGLGGMNLDIGANLPEMDSNGMGVGAVDGMKLEMDCGMDKMDDLSGVLDGNPFDSIPNLSDELDGLDLDMVDGLCDFEVLLSEEKQHASFFSLIRDVLCSTRDHRMTLVCLEKTIKKWTLSQAAPLNPWFMRVQDWNYALVVGLNFLAGNYQDVHPEDFVPYIEYKYKTKYYQWIGAGRDGDNNLSPLCNLWMDNLDKLPPLRKSEVDGDEPEEEEDDNEDSDTGFGGDPSEPKKKNKRPQTPPPPRCTTEWAVRPSTDTEKDEFRQQEKHRFENPHKAFTYTMHDYESVVGPVKGVYSSQTGITNKARGHSLLVDDRPPYVTILALVRDAVARLPNGEGTRSEICEMLRDSAFLAPEASNVTLNSVVSGALDRLHYERDPCVRYDSHKKSWIYLHRDRSQEQFERLHHNRSYTKSTKSRNNSNRKIRKGSKSSTSSSTAVATGASQSSSSSSSQCSTSAIVESSLQGAVIGNTVAAVVGVGNTVGGAVTTASGNALVTLPPLNTMNQKIQGQLTTLTSSSPAGITSVTQQQLQQPAKQAIGIVSMTNPAGIQVQAQQSAGLSGALQQSLAAVATSRGGLVSIPASSTMTIQDGTQIQQQQQASLNDVLAAAAGLRFQTSPGSGGTQMMLNQNLLTQGQQQGKPQQATFIQDPSGSGATARLVLQQSQQPGTLSATMQQGAQSQNGIQVQSQAPNNQGTTIAPGQILLGSSAAAVLKLAGNIRLSDGLRLAQLRLPTGGPGQPGATSLSAASPLRLPQHRILLARGTLPGQSQAQGVLLGQTSSGQTVILSAGPAGAGPLAGLQQALAAGGSSASGQIALHAAAPPTIQLDASPSPSTTTLSGQQQQTGMTQQSLQGFATNQSGQSATSTTKFGILTNVAQGGNSIVVSSGAPTAPIIQGNYSTVARIQQTSQMTHQQQPVSTSTLPSTSIALPASLLAPTQTLSASTGTATIQSPPNVTVSTSQLPPQHQQLILTSGSTGHSQQQGQTQTSASQQIGALSGGQTLQLQSGMQQQQHSQSHQSLILQQSQQNVSHLGSSQQSQAHHQLTAPIIIRSAQGDFVSFGIPSHLSLGRGVQGIKVIPFQAGKQTVLARIVAPPPTSVPSSTGSPTTSMTVPSAASSLLSSCSTLTSNNLNAVVSTIANVTTSSTLTAPAAVQLTKVPPVSSSSSSLPTTQIVNPSLAFSAVVSSSASPTVATQSTMSLPAPLSHSLQQQQPSMTTSCSTPITTIHGGVAVTAVTGTSNVIHNNQSSNVTAIATTVTATTTTNSNNVSSS